MFKKLTPEILAPLNGQIKPVSECEDAVFAQKILGDGVFIEPDPVAQKVVSPVSGKITNVFDSLHAYGIESHDGLEILVHIGLNTVELEGEGFTSKVSVGKKVRTGDVLCEVDFAFLAEKGYSLQTPVVITDMSAIQTMEPLAGPAQAGKTIVMHYQKK